MRTRNNIATILKDYAVQQWPIDELNVSSKNPRKITEKQKDKASSLVHATGFMMPIVVDQKKQVVIGHEWLEAAKILGLDDVPVIHLSDLSEADARALRIGYPKIIDLGEWDVTILAEEFEIMLNDKIDLSTTGFDLPEIDIILSEGRSENNDKDNEIVEIAPSQEAVSKLGDLWLLGKHRILCGSATDPESYKILMGDQVAQAIISDPPYNVPNQGHTGGRGTVKHREFPQAHGEMTEGQFIEFLSQYLTSSTHHLCEGGLVYSFMDWRHEYEMLSASRSADLQKINLVIWNKNNGGMGSLYRSKHELVYVLKKGKAKHINNVELGKNGRYRTNVWDYAGVNSFKKDRMKELSTHPTVKPVEMIADAILDCTHLNQIVLDPFSGSGTIFIACEKTNRIGYGMDLDPLYVDAAIRRWEAHTGQNAIHATSKKAFSACQSIRSKRRTRG
ncbi:DNA modification methylase [Micavibrio aeruginosavorus]|uniref:Methyltransferase n=1 Tax=Micavibrio aeruginosavorus EPB TaxID=349215 RepID=M4VWV3_9BACT|nr:DNA methyltransferase [Micavibrio aeruginosavorus]AGH97679.1 ParB-like nuclease [Micavibrio aeruginosavorus EPB]